MISRKKAIRTRKGAVNPPQKRFGQTDKRVHRDLYAAIIDHSLSPGTALQEDVARHARLSKYSARVSFLAVNID